MTTKRQKRRPREPEAQTVPAALDIQRLAEDIYMRISVEAMKETGTPLQDPLTAVATVTILAQAAFVLARAFAEVAEEEFRASRLAADKERADKKPEEANR